MNLQLKQFYFILIFSTISISLFGQTSIIEQEKGFNFEGTNFKPYNSEKELLQFKQLFAEYTYKKNAKRALSGIVTLPVVVHVISNGTVGQVSDVQIQNGITYLNEAFSGTGHFNTSIETNIRFKLAQRDPQGNATTGITHNESIYTSMDMQNGTDGKPIDDQHVKNLNRWNPKDYINIWIVSDVHEGTNTSVAGYAYLPGVLNADINRDGVVMESNYFGSSAENTSVLIHEIGHYFGLLHTFDGGCTNNNCTIDGDGMCDTPPSTFDNTYSCSINKNSCNTDANDPSLLNPFRPVTLGGLGDVIDMKQNFMDYSYVSCYQSFTQNQSTRMYDVIDKIRIDLVNSLGLYPCTSKIQLAISWPTGSGNAGNPITVSNNTTGATSYKWFVNGIETSNSKTLNYTPTISGQYHIKLLAQNTDKYCDVSDSNDVQIICPVVANFTNSSLQVNPNQTVSFINTSTNASSFEWYVNDVLNNTKNNFDFSTTDPGIYKISLKASNGKCTEMAYDAMITVSKPSNSLTGFPNWQLVPSNSTKVSNIDWTTNPVSVSQFNKPLNNAFAGLAVPGFSDCGEFLFYVLYNGIATDTKALNIYSKDGTLLTPNGGLNGVSGEMQVIRIPGQSNDWYVIYKSWMSNGLNPSNWKYTQIHYTGGNDFKIVKQDVPLYTNKTLGTTSTYTYAAAVSRTVDGDSSKQYLYLMERVTNNVNIAIHRYIIDKDGITFNKSTGTINYGWHNYSASMTSAELNADESILAITSRSYNANASDITLIDCKFFDNILPHYKLIALENQLLFNKSTNQWVEAQTLAPNIGNSVAYIEFSPNSAFLFCISGGNTGNAFLTQIDVSGDVFSKTKLQIRTRMKSNLVYPDNNTGLYDICSSYDGNLYFAEQNKTSLYVIPKDTANNYLYQDLTTGDFDFSTKQTPNIAYNNGTTIAELPDQIDGYNYLKQNTIGTDIAIKTIDCNGLCSSKKDTIEILNASTHEIINRFATANCNSTIHFCANYFKKYSLREASTGKVVENAIVNGIINYPANQTTFTFLPETNCGSTCNSSDAALTSVTQTCKGKEILLSLTIKNNGLDAVSANMPISIYNNTISIASLLKTTQLGVQILASETKTIQVSIPKQTNANLQIQLNDDGTFASKASFPVTSYIECDYTNNTGSILVNYPQFNLDLGNDIVMCENESRILKADDGFANYLWLDNYSTNKTNTVYKAGTYKIEATDICGIKMYDSVKVIVNTTPTLTVKASICDGNKYSFRGNDYSTSGVYSFTKKNSTGCDSIITLILDINKPTNSTTNAYIKKGKSYTFNGKQYTQTGTYTAYLTNKAGCDSIATLNLTVNMADITICAGNSVTLTTNIDGLFKGWTPVVNIANPLNRTTTATPSQTTQYLANILSLDKNIISNGNFEGVTKESVSINTQYIPNQNPTVLYEGFYDIVTNPNNCHGSFGSFGDHTSGTGQMMVFNGSYSTTTKVWTKMVNVTPNTNYIFSTWIASAYGENPAKLQFSINGKTLNTPINAEGVGEWLQFYATWNSGSSNSADISIVNQNINPAGNDFVLDDISFSSYKTIIDTINVIVNPIPKIELKDISTCSSTLVNLDAGAGMDSYTWSTGAKSQSIETSNNGTYSVTVTKANCSQIAKSIVKISTPTSSTINKTICTGNTVTIDGVVYSKTGTYHITTKNKAGCDSLITLDLTVRPLPVISFTTDKDTSNIYTSQSIELTGTATASGANIVSVLWSGDDSKYLDITNKPKTNFLSNKDGIYTLTYSTTDNFGCTNSQNLKLKIKARDTIQVQYNANICGEGVVNIYSVQTQSGNLGEYYWNIEPTISINNSNPTSHIMVIWDKPGKYTITVEDKNKTSYQKVTKTFTINVYAPITTAYDITGPKDVCAKEETLYSVDIPDSIENKTTVKWSVTSMPENSIIQNEKNSTSVKWKDINTENSPEYIKLQTTYRGCSEKATLYPVTIHKTPKPNFNIYLQDSSKTKDIYPGKTVEVDNKSYLVNPSEIDNKNLLYYWDFDGDGVYVEHSFEPTFTYDEIGTHNTSLIAVDPIWGCKDTITKQIIVSPNPKCSFIFPNTFTPESNTNTNFSYAFSEGIVDKDFSLKVYNRWGQLIWETNNRHETWDGRYNGEMCKQDVYVYHAQASCENGKTISNNGDLTLLK